MKTTKTMVAMTILLTTAVAQAEFIIDFYSSFGIFNAEGTGGCLPNFGDTALLQLIYAGTNGVADTEGNNPVAISGDDELLWSGTYMNIGGTFEDFAYGDYDIIVTAYRGTGLVYGQLSTYSNGVLSYYTGHIQQMFDRNPATIFTPDEYDLGQGLDNQRVITIPEPSTLGLMGIAGVGLLLVRCKRRGTSVFGTVRNPAWRCP